MREYCLDIAGQLVGYFHENTKGDNNGFRHKTTCTGN